MLSTLERHTSRFALVIVIRRVNARTVLEILFKTAFAAAESIAKVLLAVVNSFVYVVTRRETKNIHLTRMWANAQPDGRPPEHRWRPLFNAAKFG